MRPILQCFSSVVGPNGSGKSNVIDAMLFVFGKRAKQVRSRPSRKHNGAQQRFAPCTCTEALCAQLRLSKVSELIHKSANHQNLDSARVSVYFQEIIDMVQPGAARACPRSQSCMGCRKKPTAWSPAKDNVTSHRHPALECCFWRLPGCRRNVVVEYIHVVPLKLLTLWCHNAWPLQGSGYKHGAPLLHGGPQLHQGRRPVGHAAQPPQGDEEYTVVPGSDFSVARTALRSNTSQYYIDGRKSSQGQVTDLLKAKGVDLDNNRFLILQARAPGGAKWGLCRAPARCGARRCWPA